MSLRFWVIDLMLFNDVYKYAKNIVEVVVCEQRPRSKKKQKKKKIFVKS
jgi:hypothetical protein